MTLSLSRPLVSLLVLGVTEFVINKFSAGSMTEAWNLKEFLEQAGDYDWVEIYMVPSSEGPVTRLNRIELVAP